MSRVIYALHKKKLSRINLLLYIFNYDINLSYNTNSELLSLQCKYSQHFVLVINCRCGYNMPLTYNF